MSKQMVALLLVSILFGVISSMLLGVNITSSAGIGYVFGRGLGTVGLAVIIALIPAGIYWLFKRKQMPGLTITIWALWGLFAVLSLAGNMMAR